MPEGLMVADLCISTAPFRVPNKSKFLNFLSIEPTQWLREGLPAMQHSPGMWRWQIPLLRRPPLKSQIDPRGRIQLQFSVQLSGDSVRVLALLFNEHNSTPGKLKRSINHVVMPDAPTLRTRYPITDKSYGRTYTPYIQD